MRTQECLQSEILDSKNNGLLLEYICNFYLKNFDRQQELFSNLAELHNLEKSIYSKSSTNLRIRKMGEIFGQPDTFWKRC